MTNDMKMLCGDCLDKMKLIDAESIDLVVADPPYNVNYAYRSYKDNMPFSDYLDWQLDVLQECERVLTTNGSLFYLNYPEFNSYIYCNLDTNFDMKPIEIITWIYNAHTGGVPLRKASRTWIWASKGTPINNFYGEYRNPNDKRVLKLIEQGRKPASYDWWMEQQVKNVSREKTEHPCQLPESIVEKIVLGATNEGGMVLDPFMGSGTTGVVCRKTRRAFIGIEMDEAYFAIAEARCASTEGENEVNNES